ncbi:unnamed protein product [Prorocentrum cordatum]|uniref:Uncharacterized protein n=1 Tax=Prorocentrum cordatum TaxID=2364126 RepID=A0ABN9TM47_9DINO|nr:unnamed protein product [Polarella glacialis]
MTREGLLPPNSVEMLELREAYQCALPFGSRLKMRDAGAREADVSPRLEKQGLRSPKEMPEGAAADMDAEPKLNMQSWCSCLINAGGAKVKGEGGDGIGAKAKKARQTADEDIPVPIVKLVLTNTGDIGDMGAILYAKFELPVSAPLIAVTQGAGEKCNDEATELKEKKRAGETVDHKSRGLAHLQIFMAAFGHAATRTPATGAKRAEEAKLTLAMFDVFNNELANYDSPAQVGQQVGYSRVKTHNKEENAAQMCTWLWYVKPRHKHAAAVQEWLEQLAQFEGEKELRSGPPRGPLERKLSKSIDDRNRR